MGSATFYATPWNAFRDRHSRSLFRYRVYKAMTPSNNRYTTVVSAAIALIVGLSSCDAPTGDRENTTIVSPSISTRTTPSPEATPSTATSASPGVSASPRSQALNPSANSPAGSASTSTTATANTTSVTIYKVDNQCQGLVPEKVAVSSTNSLDAAIAEVLKERDTADFNLSGYRVSVDPDTRVATVDLRVTPGSTRDLDSLSSCEQLALFGTLRRTLTENSQWNIESVRFTEQGEEVVL